MPCLASFFDDIFGVQKVSYPNAINVEECVLLTILHNAKGLYNESSLYSYGINSLIGPKQNMHFSDQKYLFVKKCRKGRIRQALSATPAWACCF